jgi:glycosyltransferase involved in cell wall biosynthesis
MRKHNLSNWVLILDRATPHNNILIKEILKNDSVNLKICYAIEEDKKRYDWKNSPTHSIKEAKIYGRLLNFKFLLKCIFSSESKFIIVGWSNINTILLHVIFFLLRRKYNHWSDLPDLDVKIRPIYKQYFRNSAYWILRNSKSHVFGVGIHSINGFIKLGFPKSRIFNLPIFIEVTNNVKISGSLRNNLCLKHKIPIDKFILLSGSRLVHEKGYDLLLSAFSLLEKDIKQNSSLVIVGSGEELVNLKILAQKLDISNNVLFLGWLEMNDFIDLMRISDIFIHPARFDSYGGTIYAMEASLPVIGSIKAGAAIDRIEHGINGFLYQPNDINSLAMYISKLYNNPALKESMSQAARKTALRWHPSLGVDTLRKHLI